MKKLFQKLLAKEVMRTLYILRHAKAVDPLKAPTDYARRLSSKGREEAQAQAEWLANSKFPKPDLIMASSGLRTAETAAHVASYLQYSADLKLCPNFYLARPKKYLEALHTVDPAILNVMMVGHNPGISGFVELLTGQTGIELPTAGLCILQAPADLSWDALQASAFTLQKIHTL
jgi:phosphohistidine phosphatase